MSLLKKFMLNKSVNIASSVSVGNGTCLKAVIEGYTQPVVSCVLELTDRGQLEILLVVCLDCNDEPDASSAVHFYLFVVGLAALSDELGEVQ
uniref:Uncharacterized protein n=1 Tax=Arion vulgaris TaxID=1028688 RepID=A0A0B6ZQA1_9EUPU